MLIPLFESTGEERSGPSHFMTMFMWEQLLEAYAPARDAYVRARDEQVRQLLLGDAAFPGGGNRPPRTRFQLIVTMNETLDELHATYELFVQFESLMPELARKQAFLALPAIIEARDFALAERYLADPLDQLDRLNQMARDLHLFPPAADSPRLGAELANFMKDVRLRSILLDGLERESEADTLRLAALSGIASDDMRALAERELAAPGTIMQELSDRFSQPHN